MVRSAIPFLHFKLVALIFHLCLFYEEKGYLLNGPERVAKQLVYLFGAPSLKKDQNKGHKIKRVFTRSCICNIKGCVSDNESHTHDPCVAEEDLCDAQEQIIWTGFKIKRSHTFAQFCPHCLKGFPPPSEKGIKLEDGGSASSSAVLYLLQFVFVISLSCIRIFTFQ